MHSDIKFSNSNILIFAIVLITLIPITTGYSGLFKVKLGAPGFGAEITVDGRPILR